MTTAQTSAPTRRQRRREATMNEILHAARMQMRRDGAGALNLNEVARQVGLRPPSLYEYFPGGKHELLDALFRLGIEQFGERLRPLLLIENPAESLYRGMEIYLRFAVETPELYQICYERPVPDFVPSAESLELSVALLGELRSLAERWLARSPNPLGLTLDQVQELTLAISHGIAALHLANEPHLPPGQGRFGSLIPAATAVLVRALGLTPPTTGELYSTLATPPPAA